jgi:hypothetical protein
MASNKNARAKYLREKQNRKARHDAKQAAETPAEPKEPVASGVQQVPMTLKGVCTLRERNWAALKPHKDMIHRLITYGPRTAVEITLAVNVMGAALTELMAREMIEAQIDKTVESMAPAPGPADAG